MSVRLNSDLARRARCSVSHIRNASTTTKVRIPTPRPEHGQQIYVFHQFQTNQVVYSLTKSLQVLASPSILSPSVMFNAKATRTMPRFVSSPSMGRNRFLELFEKTFGRLWQGSPSPPALDASGCLPFRNCANIDDCMNCHGTKIPSPETMGKWYPKSKGAGS